MAWLPATESPTDLDTDTSALVPTVVLYVAVSFVVLGSEVAAATHAVSVITPDVPGSTSTVSV